MKSKVIFMSWTHAVPLLATRGSCDITDQLFTDGCCEAADRQQGVSHRHRHTHRQVSPDSHVCFNDHLTVCKSQRLCWLHTLSTKRHSAQNNPKTRRLISSNLTNDIYSQHRTLSGISFDSESSKCTFSSWISSFACCSCSTGPARVALFICLCFCVLTEGRMQLQLINTNT